MNPTETHRLSSDQIRRTFTPDSLGTETTRTLKPLGRIIGQNRAVAALQFGLGIDTHGYNVFVTGPPGIGKMTAVESFLESQAQSKAVPPDWCYVNNFVDPDQPVACRLPAGRGRQLQRDMLKLIDHFREEIPKALESEEYGDQRGMILQRFNQQRTQTLEQLHQEATAKGFKLEAGKLGIALIPLREGQPLDDQALATLTEAEKAELQTRREGLEARVKAALKQIRVLQHEMEGQVRHLDRQLALNIVVDPIDELIETYDDLAEVLRYLKAVQKDILEHIALFGPAGPAATPAASQEPVAPRLWEQALPFRKYQVNVLVENGARKGAPVVIEPNPTFPNLFGRIEKETQFGFLYTDFLMVKAGSLHRANGGYLVVNVEDLLRNPLSWQGLKRAIQGKAALIEDPIEQMGTQPAKTLKPQAIPLDAKIILVGQTFTYHLLQAQDEEFAELFKVKADFDTRMACTPENINDFSCFLCTLCEKEHLRHLDATAIAALLAHALRLSGDQEKLSTQFGALADVVREANFWAQEASSETIGKHHVQKALDEKVYRSNLVKERIGEMIARRTLLIDVDGRQVGQVNGLSVLAMGDYAFGKPSRITVSAGPGRGGIIDIEREIQLGGPIHSKGVLILSGYLTKKFARAYPLSLSARVVFEQSYEGIEGDSAASAELYALLSELAQVPIRQGIAVTGSVNQHGVIQAIGGANEKIEGFFDICQAIGLSAAQGVILPRANIKNLMLREDVVAAVAQKNFHVWAVDNIDEGMEILTGIPSGTAGPDGSFPPETINHRVNERLQDFARCVRAFAEPDTPLA